MGQSDLTAAKLPDFKDSEQPAMDKKSLITLEYKKVLKKLAEFTAFSGSEDLALSWLPTGDSHVAGKWQAETAEACKLLDKRTDISIGGARDVRSQVETAVRGAVLRPDELLQIQASIAAGRDLRRKLVKQQDQAPNLSKIAELIEECPGIVSAINSAIDERGDIIDSASEDLQSIRRQLRIVHSRIQDKLRSLLGSSQNEYLQEPTISLRGGRYVVPLRTNFKGRIKGIVHDQSNSGATLWIEPFNTVELNNEFRGLQIAEEDEIRRILAELSALVANQADSVIRLVERIAELDLVFARARYALTEDAIRPQFVPWRQPQAITNREEDSSFDMLDVIHPGSTIWIRGARHPLIPPDTVVPTDILVDDETFVVLITGPNTGGKTVSLKTIGLMVLMAQAGLHLPAIEARLSVFEDILADIGDEQSIEQNLSTFSGHMRNIVKILNKANDRTLILLDELGSGTDPAEGSALAQSIVRYLQNKGATTFIATHFPELKLYASQTPGAINASLLFDDETFMPTYEMTIGMPGRSNAFAIARQLGLDQVVLDDALKHLGTNSSDAEILLDSIYDMREKMSSQEAGTRLALKQAKDIQRSLADRLESIDKERQAILEETHKQAEAELAEIRSEIKKVRRKLRDAESKNQLKKLQKKTEVLEEGNLDKLAPASNMRKLSKKKKPLRSQDLQIGDRVYLTTIGAKGYIVGLSKNEAEVSVGRLHMRTKLEDLELRGNDKSNEEELESEFNHPPLQSPGMELDLRGQRVEDGLISLEQYLDNAFLSNLPWVRIIHGKGTGRLREAVRQALDNNEQVLAWEEGKDGEGGAGVTVARFASES